MLMALDRYVAICHPLRYASILTSAVIAKAGLATLLRGVMLIFPFTFLTKRLPYCRGNFIPHTYCDHMSVAKVSCGKVKVNAIYGLLAALLIGGFDIFCISMSYTMILRAVVSLSSADARQKAFSTSNCKAPSLQRDSQNPWSFAITGPAGSVAFIGRGPPLASRPDPVRRR
ncbi:hypothetical protein R6Z07M_014159 [Ovis aries]